ncbi:MAG TPA: tetratricopeptide repeat protein, partial [Verrucomicrobiota bacterium]|nr:tetratricopeptide repeat protein [Verrucomicrobiota bacterium]
GDIFIESERGHSQRVTTYRMFDVDSAGSFPVAFVSMVASLLDLLYNPGYLLSQPWFLLVSVFQLWMFVDAVRQKEWIWAVFIFIGWGLAALLYYLMVYRATPSATRGFELPGAHDRRRIKELEAQIHHLDKAHHYSQLGDIYFQQGKLQKAEACYRAARERDPEDIDTRAHLGQCLLRQKRPAEARPLLEGVIAENPKHDYGHTMMALAETLMALGEQEEAIRVWKQVTENHSYPRAKVQLAELYLARNQPELARAELQDVLADDAHAPAFQRRRDRVWISRAKSLARRL